MEERHSDLKDFINLRTGGFHATCIFLGFIGKRFGDAGLKYVMVQSGILEKMLLRKFYDENTTTMI